MKFKFFAIIFLIISSGTSLIAKSQVTVWSWDTAADALKSVAKKSSGVKVIDKGYNPVYDQLTAGCTAGGINLPDVITLENGAVERYLEQFPNCFTPLNQFGVKSLVKDFPAYKWIELKKGKKIYGVPWDSGQVVFFYRRDIFKKAKVNPNSIKTWDDFIEAGKKVKKATRNRVTLAMSSHASGDNYFNAISQQNNCSYFNKIKNKTYITINQKGCVEALEIIKKLVKNKAIRSGGWDDKIQAIKANRVAGILYGSWFEGTIRNSAPEQSGKWGVIKMPAVKKGGLQAANLGGSSLLILNSSKNKKAAYQFVKTALANNNSQIQMLKEQGLVPSYLPSLNSSYINQGMPFWGNQKIWKLILSTTKDIKAFPKTKFSSTATKILISVQNKYIDGGYSSAKQALDIAAKQISQATKYPIAK